MRSRSWGGHFRETLHVAPFRLVSLAGGKSWNAIPREATAVCSVSPDREGAFRAALDAAAGTIGNGYARIDPDLVITVATTSGAADAWTEKGAAELLDLVAVIPSGPLAMSSDFEGLVETSSSLGEAVTEGERLTLHSLSGSSNSHTRPDVMATLDADARLVGGRLEVGQSDPGWSPDLGSPALAACQRVFRRLFDEAPVVTAVHAWLETAVIGDRIPGLDMVSIGPQIEGPHSPDERVCIATVGRFWSLLTGVVDELSTVGIAVTTH